MKILVIDDDEMIRDFLEDFFSELGCEVVTAANGFEALEKVDEDIELVITDRKMPWMLGEELIRKIKLLFPKMRTILMTGDRLSEEEEKVIKAAGADEILHKPFRLAELMQVIKYC